MRFRVTGTYKTRARDCTLKDAGILLLVQDLQGIQSLSGYITKKIAIHSQLYHPACLQKLLAVQVAASAAVGYGPRCPGTLGGGGSGTAVFAPAAASAPCVDAVAAGRGTLLGGAGGNGKDQEELAAVPCPGIGGGDDSLALA